MSGTFLRAEWRKLIMAQYAVEAKTLAPYLPAGTELDLFQGRWYVSLVGFLFCRVRVMGVAIPFHTRFEEINLRLYVRRTDTDGRSRRGVVFTREFTSRPAITAIANALYEEPYATAPTRHAILETAEALDVRYEWRHGGRWHGMEVRAANEPAPIAAGSVEEFITEHYWGFTKRSDGSTSQYEVKHPRWLTYPITGWKIDVDFGALYGAEFAGLNRQEPESVLLAEGSAVSVGSGSRLTVV